MDIASYKYLFLDRDGVINVERKADYVKNVSEWEFVDGSLAAISKLSNLFRDIFVITNQRGVGKGIMSRQDLEDVHKYMLEKIVDAGGNIRGIYFCTDLDSSSINRKPNIGMAFQVQAEFPEVDFSQSLMIGNSRSDIEFGKKAGMYTILVGEKYPKTDKIYNIADSYFSSLHEFALSL